MNETLPNHIQDRAHQSAVYLDGLDEIQVLKVLTIEGINWFLISICLMKPTRANLFFKNS